MTLSLSLTFEPPSTATNGRVGCSRRPSEHLDLGGEEAAGGAGQVLRGPDDRRVGAVRRAEGVVHVGVEAVDEPGHEGRVVALLARVEAQVLEQLDPGRQLGEPGADRRHRVALVGRALGPAEVGRGDDRGALLLQPLDGGQRGADAEVVGDGPVLDRHVEVGAEQDAPAVERREVLQGGDAEGGHALA